MEFLDTAGLYNSGVVTFEGSTLKNNKNKGGELNDIYNSSDTSVINFDSSSTNNIFSGIAGIGTVNKKGSGSLQVGKLLFEGTPQNQYISIPIPLANSVLKDYVRYSTETIETPIYNYYSSYDSSD